MKLKATNSFSLFNFEFFYKKSKQIGLVLTKLGRFKRDNETPLKTRQFFTRWRFPTRIKRVFIRRF
jgi:hypothetical protein